MTSIEWLFNELWETPKDKFEWCFILNEAKEMHKQEIENAYWDGGQDIPMSEKSCEQYYQETFKKD